MTAAGEFFGACAELYAEKKACPADDVMTVWTTAEIDGQPLDQGTVLSECLLVLDGGAETTRTVIARTILELAARPTRGGSSRTAPTSPSRPRSSSAGSRRS